MLILGIDAVSVFYCQRKQSCLKFMGRIIGMITSIVTCNEKGFILQDVQRCVNRGILPASLARKENRPANTINAHIQKE